MPTVPSGEAENSSHSGMGRATSAAGTGDTDSRMGAKETDTKIDAPMNSDAPAVSHGRCGPAARLHGPALTAG